MEIYFRELNTLIWEFDNPEQDDGQEAPLSSQSMPTPTRTDSIDATSLRGKDTDSLYGNSTMDLAGTSLMGTGMRRDFSLSSVSDYANSSGGGMRRDLSINTTMNSMAGTDKFNPLSPEWASQVNGPYILDGLDGGFNGLSQMGVTEEIDEIPAPTTASSNQKEIESNDILETDGPKPRVLLKVSSLESVKYEPNEGKRNIFFFSVYYQY